MLQIPPGYLDCYVNTKESKRNRWSNGDSGVASQARFGTRSTIDSLQQAIFCLSKNKMK